MAFLRVDPWCSTLAWSTGIVRPIEAQAEHGRDNLTALMKRIAMRHEKSSVTLPPRTMRTVAVALTGGEAAAYASLVARRRRAGFDASLEKPGAMASYVNALRLAACGLPHRFDDSPVEAAAEALRVGLLQLGAAAALADGAAAAARRHAGTCAACGNTAAAPRAVCPCAHTLCGACADSLLETAAAGGKPAAACPRCAAPFEDSELLLVPDAKTATDADDEDDARGAGAAAAASAKIAHLLASLAALPPATRCLVFSQYRPLLSRIAAALGARKLSYERFDGSGSAEKRAASLASFRADASVRVLLLDTRLAACGLTLTEATHVFIMDVPSSAGMLEQAAARAHRIGQTRPVTVEILAAKDSIEARLALRHGRRLAGDAAGGLRAADARALARQQMEWLLSDKPLAEEEEEEDAAGAMDADDDVIAPPVVVSHAALEAQRKGKAKAPPPGAVKLEHGGGGAGGAGDAISLMDEEEENEAPRAKRARGGR
jgi:SNF2 family DNA or RNA helicase